jgi:hypothetical protein
LLLAAVAVVVLRTFNLALVEVVLVVMCIPQQRHLRREHSTQ